MPQAQIVARSALTNATFRPILGDVTQQAGVAVHPWRIENRLHLSEEELACACVLLDHARHQQFFAASPCRSQFKVGSSVYCGQGRIARGSNAEYGAGPRRAYDEGVHSEEVAIVNALNHHGRDALMEMIGLASDAVTPSTSCGKCRSLLETYGKPDMIIVSVGTDLSATMWKLSELLPTELTSLSRFPAPEIHDEHVQALFAAAERARHVGFVPFSKQSLGGSVAAIAANGSVFSLPRIDSLAFYGTSSLRATLSAVLLHNPRKLECVLMSSQSGLPTGEDRQLLFEFASLFEQVDTLRVYLHKEGTQSVIATTPSALLPLGFGPHDLDMNLART